MVISDRALQLLDGRMVIPIDDEEEDGEILNDGNVVMTDSHIEKASADEEEVAVANFDDDEDSFENEPESTRSHNTQSVLSPQNLVNDKIVQKITTRWPPSHHRHTDQHRKIGVQSFHFQTNTDNM